MIEEVSIEDVMGDYPFKLFRGKLCCKGLYVRFEGVVYQSVGGPNVRASIDEQDAKTLLAKGLTLQEIAALELELQQKILNGDVSIERG
ncbi:MAG: hypothetical protein QXH12_01155 [Candidatus Caldarchaeum sp.]|uniref:Uncharacterized protein n=1 Tax=Caldiarchaeum subterraneum TaxID=311458 RepID=A0A7C5LBD3_CALS0